MQVPNFNLGFSQMSQMTQIELSQPEGYHLEYPPHGMLDLSRGGVICGTSSVCQDNVVYPSQNETPPDVEQLFSQHCDQPSDEYLAAMEMEVSTCSLSKLKAAKVNPLERFSQMVTQEELKQQSGLQDR